MDPATTAPSSSRKKPGLLINRDFALLFCGKTISGVGDYVFNTTLVLWIAVELAKDQTWAPLAVSGVLLAAAVPVLLVGPLAGVFADRWDKRRTMLRVDIIQAVVVAALVPLSGITTLPFVPGGRLSTSWTLGAIYAVVFLVNAANQFSNPSGVALIGDIVAEPERPRAMGLMQAMFALATIIGPPLAAPLLFASGVQWALIIDALSFLVAFAALLAVRAPKAAVSVAPGQRGHFLREFGAGLAFSFRNRTLATLLVAGSLAMLGAGALNALDVFFVTQNLHTAPSLYGFVGAVFSVGILFGAILASAFAQRVGLARVVWLSLLCMGIGVVVWSRLTQFVPALITLFLVGIAQSWLNVAVGPILLNVTPREMVGRVSAVLNPLLTLASLVSIVLSGYLVSNVLQGFHLTALGIAFGPLDTIFLVAGVLAVLGGLYAMAMLRQDQPPAQPKSAVPTVVEAFAPASE